jgi:hypothetical protein
MAEVSLLFLFRDETFPFRNGTTFPKCMLAKQLAIGRPREQFRFETESGVRERALVCSLNGKWLFSSNLCHGVSIRPVWSGACIKRIVVRSREIAPN